MTACNYQFSKFNNFLWGWFLRKNLSNFVPPTWNLDNPLYHIITHWHNEKKKNFFTWLFFRSWCFSAFKKQIFPFNYFLIYTFFDIFQKEELCAKFGFNYLVPVPSVMSQNVLLSIFLEFRPLLKDQFRFQIRTTFYYRKWRKNIFDCQKVF